MRKFVATTGIALSVLLVSGCSTAAPNGTSSPSPTPTASETSSAEAINHPFGTTARIANDETAWELTIDEPVDAPARLASDFPLANASTRYVLVHGRAERINGPMVRPVSELSIDGIVNNVIVSDEYLGDKEFVSLNAAPEVLKGGKIEFTQVYPVPDGQTIDSVLVRLVQGGQTTAVTFGSSDSSPQESAAEPSDTQNLGTMQSLWTTATPEQRRKSADSWGISTGTVTEEGVKALIVEAGEQGIVLSEATARQFLNWALVN